MKSDIQNAIRSCEYRIRLHQESISNKTHSSRSRKRHSIYLENIKIAALRAQEEVAKAPKWNKFVSEYDEELQRQMLQDPLPDDEQEIQVTDGKNVWQDTFMMDGEQCWLDNSGSELVEKVTHWMPLPEPPKEDCLCN